MRHCLVISILTLLSGPLKTQCSDKGHVVDTTQKCVRRPVLIVAMSYCPALTMILQKGSPWTLWRTTESWHFTNEKVTLPEPKSASTWEVRHLNVSQQNCEEYILVIYKPLSRAFCYARLNWDDHTVAACDHSVIKALKNGLKSESKTLPEMNDYPRDFPNSSLSSFSLTGSFCIHKHTRKQHTEHVSHALPSLNLL